MGTSNNTMPVFCINEGQDIFEMDGPGGNWEQVPGAAVNGWVAHSGHSVCCNSAGNIFHRGPGGNWEEMDGRAVQVCCANGGHHIWCVNEEQNIWYRENPGSPWEQIDGAAVHVAC